MNFFLEKFLQGFMVGIYIVFMLAFVCLTPLLIGHGVESFLLRQEVPSNWAEPISVSVTLFLFAGLLFGSIFMLTDF